MKEYRPRVLISSLGYPDFRHDSRAPAARSLRVGHDFSDKARRPSPVTKILTVSVLLSRLSWRDKQDSISGVILTSDGNENSSQNLVRGKQIVSSIVFNQDTTRPIKTALKNDL